MTERPSTTAIWVSAARPKTLGAAFAPVFIGTAMAYTAGVLDVGRVLACLLGAVTLQLGTNFVNDYCDNERGADTPDRLGPTRATAAGWVSPAEMRRAIGLVYLALIPTGAYLVAVAGWPIAVIGIASIVASIAYTGGPYPLAYHGLGDPFVLLFFGPIAVAGTFYTQALEVSNEAVLAGLMPGLIATALLAVNNLRDIPTDRVANKRTLAVRFGPTFTKIQITLCLVVPILVLPVLLVVRNGHPAALLSMLAMLPAVSVIKRAWTLEGRDLVPVLGDTGKVLVLHSVLFGLGWIGS
jgi:1,4-dihydroxy-2-naphthoate octaprenyltransferase